MAEAERFMRRAYELARRGEGRTSPNPCVGAVIVRDGGIVGEGWHEYAGGPHAEVVAIKSAGRSAAGGTMYVTLEPCNIYGRTPPCTEAIVKAGIEKVVYGTADPNPAVSGRSVEVLKEAGLEVEEGPHKSEITRLNEAYNKHIAIGLPFVTAKVAMSLDGKIATARGDSRWITGETARKRAHEIRSKTDAILTGAGTVKADDPMLNVRLEGYQGRQPLRVVVDDGGTGLPESAAVFKTADDMPTVLAVPEDKAVDARRRYEGKGVEILAVAADRKGLSLEHLLRELGQREVVSVLVEAGPRLLTNLIAGDLIDKFLVFVAPVLIGGRDAPTFLAGQGIENIENALHLEFKDCENIGEDILITAYPRKD